MIELLKWTDVDVTIEKNSRKKSPFCEGLCLSIDAIIHINWNVFLMSLNKEKMIRELAFEIVISNLAISRAIMASISKTTVRVESIVSLWVFFKGVFPLANASHKLVSTRLTLQKP